MNFMRNNNSMDDDIIPEVFEKNNEVYMEICEQEVNNMLPRLQRLSISDDETMDLPSDSGDISCFSVNTAMSSINNFEGQLRANSNEKVSAMFVSDTSGNIWVREDTKVAVDNKKSLHRTFGTLQDFSINNLVDTQSQEVPRQILDETKKIKEIRAPMDISLKLNIDLGNKSEPTSAISENKTGLQSLMDASEEMEHRDSETGELLKTLNIILPKNPGRDRLPDKLGRFPGDMDDGIIFDSDQSKLSFSGYLSSDDQSHKSNGIMIDSPPNFEDTSVEEKPSKKISVFVPPIVGMNEIRQRRFSILQPQSTNMNAIEVTKTNSSSDDDSKKSFTIPKGSPRNSKRRCRKTAKSSPLSKTLNPSDLANDEEKRPSPCKRKKLSSENLAESSGKFRKRSVSEHNSETGEKIHLVIRSRSLSPSSKNSHHNSGNNQPTEISVIPQSRKRTNSDSINTGHVKCRKSSSSSDDIENQ